MQQSVEAHYNRFVIERTKINAFLIPVGISHSMKCLKRGETDLFELTFANEIKNVH